MTLRGLLWVLFGLALVRAVGSIAQLGSEQKEFTIHWTRAEIAFKLIISLCYAGFLLWVQYNF